MHYPGIGKKPGPSPNDVIATGSRQLPQAVDTIDRESVRCFLRALELQSRHSLGLQRQLSSTALRRRCLRMCPIA